jgi:hypothetical protein
MTTQQCEECFDLFATASEYLIHKNTKHKEEDQDRPFTVGDMKRALQGLDDDIQILIGGDEACNFDWANLNLDYEVPNEKEGYTALTFFIKNNYNTWQF